MCLCSIGSGETVSSHGATRENVVTVTKSSTSFYITLASSNSSNISSIGITKTTYRYENSVYSPSSSYIKDPFILLAMTTSNIYNVVIAVYSNAYFLQNILLNFEELSSCKGVAIRQLNSTQNKIYCSAYHSSSNYLYIGTTDLNSTRFRNFNRYNIISTCSDTIEADHNIIAIS